MLYKELPLRSVQKLQMVQNTVAWMLTGVGHKFYNTSVLTHLHWLLICSQAQLKVLDLILKALYYVGIGTNIPEKLLKPL